MNTQDLLNHYEFKKVNKCENDVFDFKTKTRKDCGENADYFCRNNDCYYCEDCAVEIAHEWAAEDEVNEQEYRA